MSKNTLSILTLVLGGAFALPTLAASPQHAQGGVHPGLPHFVIKDVGSFGGGFGLYSNPGSRVLNSHGANVGINSTGKPDPFCPDWCFFDGYVDHAFEWKHGHTTDLGALADGVSSFALGINDKGLIVGISQTGSIDPGTGAPVVHATQWQDGTIRDLGSLGGSQSLATVVNHGGQIAAPSETGASDPYVNVPQANCLWLPSGAGTACNQFDFGTNMFLLPVTSQTHAALGTRQGLKDLGTLGGPDSAVIDINDSDQAVGWSYANYNAGTSGVPDTRPVLWDHGTITDMGSLGGTFGAAMLINKNGQATGVSNLPGDTTVHPFIWDKNSNTMQDIGSLGGWYSHPNWINDNGDVVGISSTADNTRRAFYWHDGELDNLGTIGTDARSVAVSINNNRQIVGYTFGDDGSEIRGFISDQGGALVDINTLIRKPHGLNVLAAYYINDSGEVVGFALTQSGEIHPVVLIPENSLDRLTEKDGSGKFADEGPQNTYPVEHVKRGSLCERGRMFARLCATR